MYCTQNDLELRAGTDTLTQWAYSATTGTADATIVSAACTWADNEINHALTDLFAAYLPFTTAALPAILKNIAVTFAVYWLWSRRQEGGADSSYYLNYTEARKSLAIIANGETALIDPDGANLTPERTVQIAGATARSTTLGQTPIFTRRTLRHIMRH